MKQSILSSDPIYGHLTNRERRYVEALQRRAGHLHARIEANLLKDLTYDRHEHNAITWALGIIANARTGSNGLSKDKELV